MKPESPLCPRNSWRLEQFAVQVIEVAAHHSGGLLESAVFLKLLCRALEVSTMAQMKDVSAPTAAVCFAAYSTDELRLWDDLPPPGLGGKLQIQ